MRGTGGKDEAGGGGRRGPGYERSRRQAVPERAVRTGGTEGGGRAAGSEALRPPRSLLDKLGVAAGSRVCLLGLGGEPWFLEQVGSRTDDVTVDRLRRAADVILLRVDRPEDLARLARIRPYLKPDGAIWVVRPKGTGVVRETDVIDAGRRAGLVDNKIASFSDRLSAMRLVIPLALR